MTLFVVCGLPGSGKTTLARSLEAEHHAIRMCPDEWMRDLWDQQTRQLLEQQMWTMSQQLLRLGVSVVIEFGSWSRAERDTHRRFARDVGVRVELHYLDVPLDELERRVAARNREGISRAHLDEWSSIIERPTPEEVALFDQ